MSDEENTNTENIKMGSFKLIPIEGVNITGSNIPISPLFEGQDSTEKQEQSAICLPDISLQDTGNWNTLVVPVITNDVTIINADTSNELPRPPSCSHVARDRQERHETMQERDDTHNEPTGTLTETEFTNNVTNTSTVGANSSLTTMDKCVFSIENVSETIDSEILDLGCNNEEVEVKSLMDTETVYQNVALVPSSDVDASGVVNYILVMTQPDIVSGLESGHNPDGGVLSTPNKFTSDSNTNNNKSQRQICSWCPYTTDKQTTLVRHMKTHAIERPYKCTVCDRAFKSTTSLNNHVNTHTGVRPHQCESCSSAFTTSGELIRHRRYRHTFDKPHKCPQCSYASVEMSKMRRHIRSHTGEKPYRCEQCNYASPDQYKLKRHMRVHTGDKPYVCEFCLGRFTQSNSLKAHALTHLKKPPVYRCDICPATCSRKGDLRIHKQKLHTADKPIMCKRCNKSLPDRYTYKLHIREHEFYRNTYKCHACKFVASSMSECNDHVTACHPITSGHLKLYTCSTCQLVFINQQLLRSHVTQCHQTGCPRHKSGPSDPNCDACAKHSLFTSLQSEPADVSETTKTISEVLRDPDIMTSLPEDGKLPQMVVVHPDGRMERVFPHQFNSIEGVGIQNLKRTESIGRCNTQQGGGIDVADADQGQIHDLPV